MRQCKKCGVEKPLTAFPKSPCRGGCRLFVCRWCIQPLRTCDWCGRETRKCRRSPDGGYECYSESACAAPRCIRNETLVRLGVAHVLDRLKSHDYNLSAAARELDVHNASLGKFLQHKAPQTFKTLHQQKKIRYGNHLAPGSSPRIFDDPAALSRIILQYKGNMSTVAAHQRCSVSTVMNALRRLTPELYFRLKTEGKIVRSRKRFDDPSVLVCMMRRYNGCIRAAAMAVPCLEKTIRDALRRLTPDLYAQLIQQRRERSVLRAHRRSRPKQDLTLHPWRAKNKAA